MGREIRTFFYFMKKIRFWSLLEYKGPSTSKLISTTCKILIFNADFVNQEHDQQDKTIEYRNLFHTIIFQKQAIITSPKYHTLTASLQKNLSFIKSVTVKRWFDQSSKQDSPISVHDMAWYGSLLLQSKLTAFFFSHSVH